MNINTIAVAGLNDKEKHIILYNGRPIIHCGKSKISHIEKIMRRGSVQTNIPIDEEKQRFILKLMKEVDKELQHG